MAEKIKVAYLIVMRSFPGLYNQIKYDRYLTAKYTKVDFKIFPFLEVNSSERSIYLIPRLFKGVIGRKLFAWLWLLRNSTKYDYIIVRHLEFDIFALIFAWFIPNRIVIHHSKEVKELREYKKSRLWGLIASITEQLTGRVATRTSSGILCVTKEICDYQKKFKRLPENFPILFYPNGIESSLINFVDDNRIEGHVHMAFMAGTFVAWHGLDLLLEELKSYVLNNSKWGFTLHIIGNVLNQDLRSIEWINSYCKQDLIRYYGRLEQIKYIKIFSMCNIGIGSLAMNRIGLNEGSTLKVREMLAMGIPIYSGHKDTSLPDDFPYYVNAKLNISSILEYAYKTSKVSREEVRNTSLQFIDKKTSINRLQDFIVELKKAT